MFIVIREIVLASSQREEISVKNCVTGISCSFFLTFCLKLRIVEFLPFIIHTE